MTKNDPSAHTVHSDIAPDMPTSECTLRAAAASQGFRSLSKMCKAAGVSRRTVRAMLRTGELGAEPATRLAAALRVPVRVIESIAASVVPGADPTESTESSES